MAVVKWSPWQELEAMDRRMRRMWNEVGDAPAALPNADIYETESEFVIEIEAPGYDEKELQIELADHTLTVKGERSEQMEKKEKSFQLNERLQTSFERRFALPATVEPEKIAAEFAKGVLEIHAPKAKETTPTTVPIKTQ
jgi:HSP20 family protein